MPGSAARFKALLRMPRLCYALSCNLNLPLAVNVCGNAALWHVKRAGRKRLRRLKARELQLMCKFYAKAGSSKCERANSLKLNLSYRW